LLAREADRHGLAAPRSRPLVVGTVRIRQRRLAGAAGLAAEREPADEAAAAEVADPGERALEGFVLLLQRVLNGHEK